MTLQELNNLRKYPIEIKQLQERIFQLQRQTESATQMPNDMPSKKGNGDRIADIIVSYVDEQNKLQRLIAKRQLEELNAMSYISDIYDSQLRSIFLMRFLKGYSWTKIANEIGGGNTADSVRMQVTRYLSSEK